MSYYPSRPTRRCDLVVAVSECAVGKPVAPVRVIWNAVDPARLRATRSRAEVRASWGLPPDAKVAGYLGRLSPEKNPTVLVDLARKLPAGWWVVAVGNGPLRSRLVGKRILAPGPDPDVGSVLVAFDCLVSPSHTESFGLSIAEAMWVGIPVIATPVGLGAITPEHVLPVPLRPTGVQLAAAVLSLGANPGATRRRVARASRFAWQRFSPVRFGREWTDAIASLASAVKPVPPKPKRERSEDFRWNVSTEAEFCPFGSGACGCDAGPPRNCSHPDKPPQVRRSGCLDCQARRLWEASIA